MAIDAYTHTFHYREYVRLLRDLHLLSIKGQQDTDETEALRDEMDEH